MSAFVSGDPPRTSAGASPPRRPGSARRTSSIDVQWPAGQAATDMLFLARARDVVTTAAGDPLPLVLAEDSFEATVAADRSIAAIAAEPARARIGELVGQRGGGYLRGVLQEILPEEREGATPLYLILDDISGASLVAGWVWSQWDPDWLSKMEEVRNNPGFAKAFQREGVCFGLHAQTEERGTRSPNSAATVDLRHADDPAGWHAFPDVSGASTRRARRIDVWEEGGLLHVDSAFQDSGTHPDGQRRVLHEYGLRATADPATLEILSLEAEAHVLPFGECPGAIPNIQRLVGTRLPDLREAVLAALPGQAGCTHLNDTLRALAEVPALAERLRERTFA